MSHVSRPARAAFLIFLLTGLAAGITGLAQAETVAVSYHFESPYLETVIIDDQPYDRIIMPESPNSGAIGAPALPARGARILLPEGSRVERVEVVSGTKITVGHNVNIEPVQRPYPLSVDAALISVTPPDPAVYGLTRPIPEARFEAVGPQSFRGYTMLVLKLQPVEYIPATGELSYYTDLQVLVTTTESGKTSSLMRGLDADRREMEQTVDNPEQLASYAASKSGAKGYDLLIITSPSLAADFQPLKDYHDTTGILTEIRTTDDIGSADPDDIRAYITAAYQTDGIQYVLIGGDDDIIPARDLYVRSWGGASGYEEYAMPGDIYFACLDGPYNFDGDAFWGEPNDGAGGGDVDLVAEVFVGRASVSVPTEVQQFVNKTIRYLESTAPYLSKVLMLGEHLTFGGLGEYGGYSSDDIIDGSDAHGYTTVGIPSSVYDLETMYDMNWSNNFWPASELKAQINAGVHLINHYGHCNYENALKMDISGAFFDLLNADHFFLYSQGCNAGGFDDRECWAEYVTIKNPIGGAFAAVMNARYGWGNANTDGPSQRFDREFWDAVYDPAEGKTELGRANHDSKEDNLYRINESCMRWCYYEATLFGDPTVAIKSIRGLTFSYPNDMPDTLTIDQTTDLVFEVAAVGAGVLVSASGQVHYRVNGGDWQTEAAIEGAPGSYTATLPALDCGDAIEYYFSAEEQTDGQKDYPGSAEPHTATVIKDLVTVFADDFESDLGWTVTGLWARGVPTGQGQSDPFSTDPYSGCNGENVIGYNLNGNYENSLGEMTMTSPVIDCSGMTGVHLTFYRWLGVEYPSADRAGVAVSTDGSTWTTLWQNTCTLSDLDWYKMEFDISAIADDQPTVYLRFVMGPTDTYATYCGWNIDDLKVLSYQCQNYMCGDANGDAAINLLDVLYVIDHLYGVPQGAAPNPPEAGDANADGAINLLDVLYLIDYLYGVPQGPEPLCP